MIRLWLVMRLRWLGARLQEGWGLESHIQAAVCQVELEVEEHRTFQVLLYTHGSVASLEMDSDAR